MRPASLDDRVLIVGGGPAGLCAAVRLKQRGYRAVTVLEREGTPGGKCLSLDYRGAHYDLGANITTSRYSRVRALADEVGLTRRPLTTERRFLALNDERVPTSDDLGPFGRLLLRLGISYYLLRRATCGVDVPGFTSMSLDARKPFGLWLESKGLGPLSRVLCVLVHRLRLRRHGRPSGRLRDEVLRPGAHHLCVARTAGAPQHRRDRLRRGFSQSYGPRVIDRYELEVVTDATVRRVVRGAEAVSAQWLDGDGVQHTGTWDKLILACPLPAALAFLDCGEEERELISEIEFNSYFVTAARVENLPPKRTFFYPYASSVSPGWPVAYYQPIPGDPNDVFLFYAYGDESTGEAEVQERTAQVLRHRKVDARLDEFIVTKEWKYFPHVSCEAMTAGYFERLEALQGINRTHYVGELLTFSLIELIAQHSYEQVDSFF